MSPCRPSGTSAGNGAAPGTAPRTTCTSARTGSDLDRISHHGRPRRLLGGTAVDGRERGINHHREPFEAVVSAHGSTVLRVCRAVAGAEAADDAWSETFLSALRAYPDLPPGSNVEAWLVTIARRKALDQLRARSRRAVPVEELRHAHSTDGLPGAWDDDLWDRVRALPPKQRESLAYHYVAGMPYADVAAVLGGTPAAARRAAADGVAALRKAYRDEEAHE